MLNSKICYIENKFFDEIKIKFFNRIGRRLRLVFAYGRQLWRKNHQDENFVSNNRPSRGPKCGAWKADWKVKTIHSGFKLEAISSKKYPDNTEYD